MDYRRVRERNGLLPRKPLDDPDPYWRDGRPLSLLIGDLDRMERDYLDPVYPEPPFATRSEGSDPTSVCARATGVDVDVVRRVLGFVFREQDYLRD